MAPPKKYKGPVTAYTYRCDTEKWRQFSAVCTLLGKAPADIFNSAVEKLLSEYPLTIGIKNIGVE
jgi:hypothetical protein